jgi:Secretion system C-terminal sorting domain
MKTMNTKILPALVMTICTLSFAQNYDVQELSVGNKFLFWSVGHVHGGGDFNYTNTIYVTSDTFMVDGKTFHKLSNWSYKYSDSVTLSTLTGGEEEVICDFRWSAGDTITLAGITNIVNEKGMGTIFSDSLPYMKTTSSDGFTRTIFKKFGIVEEDYGYIGGEAWSFNSLLGAQIDGIIYGSSPTSVKNRDNPDGTTEVELYPNPTTSSLNLNVKINQSSQLKIDVYNILGQKVRTIHDGPAMKGDNNFKWNNFAATNKLRNGVYFLRIDNNNQQIIRRIILLH